MLTMDIEECLVWALKHMRAGGQSDNPDIKMLGCGSQYGWMELGGRVDSSGVGRLISRDNTPDDAFTIVDALSRLRPFWVQGMVFENALAATRPRVYGDEDLKLRPVICPKKGKPMVMYDSRGRVMAIHVAPRVSLDVVKASRQRYKLWVHAIEMLERDLSGKLMGIDLRKNCVSDVDKASRYSKVYVKNDECLMMVA